MTSSKRPRRPWMVALVPALATALVACGSSSAPLGAKSSSGGYPAAPSGAATDAAARSEAPMSPPSPTKPGDAPSASGAPPAQREAGRQDASPRPESRPGLGTEWGETRTSRITTVAFQRADPATPFATAAVLYNDSQGARAMTDGSSLAPQGAIEVGGGIVTFGLRDGDSDRFLNGFESAGRDYVVGEAGQRYVIVVQNHAPMRIEVVVSVDGLDVIDGKPAGFGKRGYLVDGHGKLEIDGFRQSEEAVAAFRFGSVRDSYASNKTGDARNVGVIGVALFHERGTTPSLWRDEARRRHDADPFPGRFATPPGH